MTLPITEHEGKKYLREVVSATDKTSKVAIDVYEVIVAFQVTCPARAHAIKKLLCAGTRNKGSELDDLKGALAALNRAIELQEIKEKQSE